jgi:dihydrodipicolinate synthase/N-acetylneuraminate lyase
MSDEQMRGVYVILCTPFDGQGNVDHESLRKLVAFCVDSGVHGIVTTANASEFWTLSDEERKAIVRLVVGEVSGRAKVVAGVTSGSAWTSSMLGRDAQEAGADALMSMPPMTGSVPLPAAYRFYEMLASSVSIPIFIQNHEPPMGTKMPPDFVVRLVSELPNVDYVKEETYPPGRPITAELSQAGAGLKGVMGGIGARYLLDEYRRGACGTMPACPWADVHVQIWNALKSGDEDRAREIHNALLPIMNYENMLSIPMYKEVLLRRGLATSDYVRSVFGNPLDDQDRRELDRMLDALEPYISIAQPRRDAGLSISGE